MSTPVVITGIVCLSIVLVIALAVFATPTGRPQHTCYFDGVRVELGAPGGRKIGGQDCSGPVEYSYTIGTEHPAQVLQSVKVCPAHVGALGELAAVLGDGASGYWVVPND